MRRDTGWSTGRSEQMTSNQASPAGRMGSRMQVVHVVPHVDAEAAGPSYSVPRLCEALAARGHEVTLSCLAAGEAPAGVALEIHKSWPVLRGFAVSTDHVRALRRHADRADIVHNHSLWSMVNVAAGLVVPGRNARLVTSPRGTLSSWALQRSRWRKRAIWPFQRQALLRADLIHATSQEEYDEVRALGITRPIAIIPNGIDLPDSPAAAPAAVPRTLLFLSRVHPKKGIENLLDAWAAVEAQFPDWRLVVAGPAEPAYLGALRRRAGAAGVNHVSFPGPLYGDQKSAAYRDASLFVLPSHSENFGMVVAEALAHGRPVIASRGTPWQGLVGKGCGWWVANDSESLRETLLQALSCSPGRLADMGARGRAWMAQDFGWKSVAAQMEAAYRWLIETGEAPAFVRTT